ncbi:hypothetical protein EHQ12_01540 [Leptospira gomenensis]|uniref:EamA domain-containing protein n=1 Tax=Leptospira gomenensis TaxID=2484974 RepID=A0A5F1YD78_9LEPT|nr:DMT family transporter [Leptospira gomenensis]TGK36023.1 hypothetical protein EHQ17_05455 [Leptospira gomenensis]TGK44445.1 hypothetical protein EHQ12_01540 [Leptospira gomenensis]TGK53374.1 hypothetical protein EHQ07_00275 [Leptospira gomenensis]TGK60692.1 hypothetical protein EHQ13_10785 [Leptospira gomenensis]
MTRIKPYLSLLSFTFFTGTTFHVTKHALQSFTPAQTGAVRFLFASAMLFLFLFFSDKKLLRVGYKNLIVFVLLGIGGVFGFNTFFFLGMKKASPIDAAIIAAFGPAITVFLSLFLLKTKIRWNQYLGTFISFVGVITVISDGNLQSVGNVLESGGILHLFIAVFCWCLYSVGIKKYLSGVSAIQTTAYTSLFGMISLVCFVIVSGEFRFNPDDIPTSAWMAILYMAVFTTFFSYLFWNYGIQKLGPDKAAVFGNLIPIVAMFTTWFLGESPNPLDIVGAIVVIAGILIVNSRFGKFKTDPIKTSTAGTA